MLKYKKSISFSLGLFCYDASLASNPNFMSDSPFTPINGPSKESDILTTVGSRDIQALKEINPNFTFTTPVVRPKKQVVTPTVLKKRETELLIKIEELQNRLKEERAEHKKEKSHLHTVISWLTNINEDLKYNVQELRINENDNIARIVELEKQLKVLQPDNDKKEI